MARGNNNLKEIEITPRGNRRVPKNGNYRQMMMAAYLPQAIAKAKYFELRIDIFVAEAS